jgi:S-adenosylmethionine:tRNA ribosyltransferase-isomerase
MPGVDFRQRRLLSMSNESHTMTIHDLDYALPPELIAQAPAADRAESRLLHYRRDTRTITHRRFAELDHLLRPGDLLVLNDAKVTPARFLLTKPTGGKVEGLYVDQAGPRRWLVLLKNLGPIHPDHLLRFEGSEIDCRILRRRDDGRVEIEVLSDEPAHGILDRIGRMPLPPYIKRDKGHDARDEGDRSRYQTVYASKPGSIAAPTAGLHFTPELFERLDAMKVGRAFVTLHVGLGTFKPIEVENLDDHVMHIERYELSEKTCETINQAKRDGRRVVVIGTTSTRVLESQPAGDLKPGNGETDLFIRPGFHWNHVGALITNFHLPKSTLIALVAGLVGIDEQRRIYAEAIRHRYRFFSYGDAMLVE